MNLVKGVAVSPWNFPSHPELTNFVSHLSLELQSWQVSPTSSPRMIHLGPNTACLGGVGINLIGNCSSIQCY